MLQLRSKIWMQGVSPPPTWLGRKGLPQELKTSVKWVYPPLWGARRRSGAFLDGKSRVKQELGSFKLHSLLFLQQGDNFSVFQPSKRNSLIFCTVISTSCKNPVYLLANDLHFTPTQDEPKPQSPPKTLEAPLNRKSGVSGSREGCGKELQGILN